MAALSKCCRYLGLHIILFLKDANYRRRNSMFRKVCAIAVVFVLILTLAAGCQKAEESDKVKVGFIYVGPAGDKGW
jgi:hypothetical protein